MSAITFKGNPLTIEGCSPKINEKAPAFILKKNDLSPATLEDFSGKVLVLVTVPSLDTPVCDLEVRRFNTEAANLSDNVCIAAVSADLPFAQARWCGAAAASAIISLSDHYSMAFAKDYGVAIKELRLLSRAIFVINAQGILTYTQMVEEITNEPNYAEALEAIKAAL